MQMTRALYRCRHDRKLAGVAAGVAEFFDLDPTLVRILWFISIFFGGVTILLYIGLALIVPLEPVSEADAIAEAAGDPIGHRHAARGTGRLTTIIGLVLILFGAVALVDVLLPAGTDLVRYLWPAFVVGVGAILVATAVRREPTRL
jgi:phage shock protein C